MPTEDRVERTAALAQSRHVDAEFHYPGAGEPLVRLAWLPSFDVPMLWEVRSVEGTLVAFRSVGTSEPEHVSGHEQIELAESALRSVLDDIALVALPLIPSLANSYVADGATYVATIYRGLRASCRFSWIEDDEPEAWTPVVAALIRLRLVLERQASPPPERGHPLCVWSSTSAAQLVRLATGEFQVWAPGEFGSLLCGHDYLLATEPLAQALKAACGDDLALEPATIIRRATHESWSCYVEVVPGAELKGPDDLPRARQSTIRAWHFRRAHLFISSEVRAPLEELGLTDLRFSPAFSQLGGMRSY